MQSPVLFEAAESHALVLPFQRLCWYVGFFAYKSVCLKSTCGIIQIDV